jgi:hypothetical protein
MLIIGQTYSAVRWIVNPVPPQDRRAAIDGEVDAVDETSLRPGEKTDRVGNILRRGDLFPQ